MNGAIHLDQEYQRRNKRSQYLGGTAVKNLPVNAGDKKHEFDS